VPGAGDGPCQAHRVAGLQPRWAWRAGTERAAFAATLPQFAALRERFDQIGFDPRGVGRSRPAGTG
jgi:pimeloyl-ACP methyl ester carboxylesterase